MIAAPLNNMAIAFRVEIGADRPGSENSTRNSQISIACTRIDLPAGCAKDRLLPFRFEFIEPDVDGGDEVIAIVIIMPMMGRTSCARKPFINSLLAEQLQVGKLTHWQGCRPKPGALSYTIVFIAATSASAQARQRPLFQRPVWSDLPQPEAMCFTTRTSLL